MQTVAFDGRQPPSEVGHFSYSVETDSWVWSDGVFAIHGYRPREVLATTEVLLQHKHPADRERAAAVLESAVTVGGTFSCYHRLVDRHERSRSVLSVGHAIEGHSGRVERVEGFIVDLTTVRREETESEVQAALAGVAEHRATIDQAKGIVMSTLGCGADTAFDRLCHASQSSNVKLFEVARLLVEAVEHGSRAAIGVEQVLSDPRPLVPDTHHPRASRAARGSQS